MPDDQNDKQKKQENDIREGFEDLIAREPVQTHHRLELPNRVLDYTATTGMLPIKDEETGETQAGMFYTAYTLHTDIAQEDRPLMFVFNGGPGSSSVWLHLGAVGPMRVRMQDEGWMPAPPYRLEPNAHTWLDLADLVFIDPVGTGYSCAKNKDSAKKFWNLEKDLESVGEFIRLYLVRSNRWSSPLYLAGESYGTTRAAGLAGELVNKGVGLNGIILISSILNFQTARFTQGNDLPYPLFLPTYTATAWYHGRLPDDLQERPLTHVLAEVETWAGTEYTLALMKGDRLTGNERTAIVDTLARYTGLSPEYVELSNLRINIHRFCKELLRSDRRTVGRLDSRFEGIDAEPVSELPDFDPSMLAITPPYTTLINDYLRGSLGYETDWKYEILSFNVNKKWEWERGKYPDTSEKLRAGLARNPYLQVFVAQGYYDLATPYFAIDYTINHMRLDPALHGNFRFKHYESGHMLYIETGSLARLKADVAAFVEESRLSVE